MARNEKHVAQLEEAPPTPPPPPPQPSLRCPCGRPVQPWLGPSVAYASEYCSSTSMHGLRYVGDQGRPPAERLLWLLLFCTSLVVCSHLIRNIWLKWEQTPVIVSFAETSTPVWEVPFPAVTICSQTKTRRSVFNYSDAFLRQPNLSDKEWEMAADLSLVCDEEFSIEGYNFTDYKTVEFLKQVAPPINETVWMVTWQNREVEFSNYLRPIMTEEGLCFTFNILDDDDIYSSEIVDVMKRINGQEEQPRREPEWSLDEGYREGAGLHTYPARALGAGQINALYILLATNRRDLDYVCSGPVQGFTVILHNPAEMPSITSQIIRLPLRQEMSVAVRPNVLATSDSLRGYSPQRKQCYFQGERHLRFFSVYTQGNCELECRTNMTLSRCSCVPFYMPRTEDTPICGLGSLNCSEELFDDMMERMVTKYGKTQKEAAGPSLDYSGCDCLPACTTLEFDTEISQGDFDLDAYFRARKINVPESDKRLISSIDIHFKEAQFIAKRRNELYGITDFIANSGGLLGLFMGFSILSLVEIIYFFSCRIGFTRRMKKEPTFHTPREEYSPVSSL